MKACVMNLKKEHLSFQPAITASKTKYSKSQQQKQSEYRPIAGSITNLVFNLFIIICKCAMGRRL